MLVLTAPRRTRMARAGALALALALVTAGCGGDDEPGDATSASTSASPTDAVGDIDVPEGVELTEAGTELDFGQPATVAYQVGQDRGSVVELVVQQVEAGRIRDLRAFQLDDATRASTPYYVQVQVTNLGTEDIGGAPVPLFAVDGRDVLIQPSSFTTSFDRCQSGPLPEQFPQSSVLTTCLVYLVPDKGTLEALSYRPLQSVEAITWTGDVQQPGQQASASPSPEG